MQDDAERAPAANSEQDGRTAKRQKIEEAGAVTYDDEDPNLHHENVSETSHIDPSQTSEATDSKVNESHKPNLSGIHGDNKTIITTMTNPSSAKSPTATDATNLAREMLKTLADYAKQPGYQLLPPEIQAYCPNARIGLRYLTILPSDGSYFLKLPLELRQMIYRCCLLRPKPSGITDGLARERLGETSLHLVSRQISCEALDILYGENVYRLYMPTIHRKSERSAFGPIHAYLQKLISAANRQRLRKVRLGCCGWYDPQGDGWEGILEGLTHLELVATPRHERNWARLGRDSKRNPWFEFLSLWLPFLVDRASAVISLLVRMDEESETETLVKKFYPENHKSISIHVAMP